MALCFYSKNIFISHSFFVVHRKIKEDNMFHKIKKYTTTNDVFNIALIILSVCLLFGVSIFQSTMTWRTDAYFHLSRIHDMASYIKTLQLPLMVDIHAFANTGQAINGMYPCFSLFPFIILTSALKPIAQYETIIFAFILLGSLLNYFVFQKLHASKLQSLTAVFATFTFINIFYSSSLNLFGVWSIYFLLPLSILSLKKISKKANYVFVMTLAASVSFVLNTHLVSAILLVLALFCYFIYLILHCTQKEYFVFKTILAGIISVWLSLPTLASIISFSETRLSTVQTFPLASSTLNIESMIHSLTNPSIFGAATPPIFGILLIADVILLSNIKHFNNNYKIIILSIFLAQFLISPYFPWALLQKTPVAIIQFPTRLVPLILSVITIVLYTANKLNKSGFLFVTIIFSVAITFSYQTSNLLVKTNFPSFRNINKTNEDLSSLIPKSRENTKIDNSTLLDPSFYSISSFPEYIPNPKNQKGSDLFRNIDTVNKHGLLVNSEPTAKYKVTNQGNSISFEFNNEVKGIVDLPIWYYPNMNYVITINRKHVPVHASRRHTLEIRNATTKNINVVIKNPKIISYSYVFSILGWITLFILPLLFKKRFADNDDMMNSHIKKH